jgi:[acyl-carrier-protein] S-malonyltransferase
MPEVAPATFRSRAGIKETSQEFEESWLKVPFETYEGMMQSEFQSAIAPHACDGKLIPLQIPRGWRRVEGSTPGKYFYVHMESGTISKFPKEMYSCQQQCWIAADGKPLPKDEVMMDPYMRVLQKGVNDAPGTMQPVGNVARSVPAVTTPLPAALAASPAVSSSIPCCLMFPGQGSQYVKMLADVKTTPKVQEMMKKAQEILGEDLLDICLNGPETKLGETKYCQPAMFIASIAAVEKLRSTKPDRVDGCQALAGLSLGEYTALHVAGVFDFETGLRLVCLRGQAMDEAANSSPQMMVSIAGLSAETVTELCNKCKSNPDDVCQIANVLFPNGFSCAGTSSAVTELQKLALATEGCLQSKLLKTSGGFHTPLMKPVQEKLVAALKDIEPKMNPPRCDVYMNFTGKKITPNTQPSEIISLLGEQLTQIHMWML